MLNLWIANHAVRRYAERVLNVDADGPFEKAMAVVKARTGLTAADIRQRINEDIEPGLPATVLLRGRRRVVRGVHARYVFNGGAVHTCYRGNEDDEDD